MHGGANSIRSDAEDERARGVWLWALDLAEQATTQQGFVPLYVMPKKRGRGSTEDISMGRRLALYLTATVGDVPCRPLAKAADVHHSTVAHHLARVEDMRETDPKLDRLLDELELRIVRRAASIIMANTGPLFGSEA